MYSRNKPGKFDIWTFFFHLFQLTKQTHYIHSSFLSNSCVFLEWSSTRAAHVAVAMSFFDSENDLSRVNIKVLIYPFVYVRSDLLHEVHWHHRESSYTFVWWWWFLDLKPGIDSCRYLGLALTSGHVRSICSVELLTCWVQLGSMLNLKLTASVWTKRTYLHA